MVLSTKYGDGKVHLAGNHYGNFVVFQVSFKFLLFLSYFVKPSREPIKQSITKVQTRFCRILTTRFPEIRQQIRITRELLNQTALKTVLLKKQINITRAVFSGPGIAIKNVLVVLGLSISHFFLHFYGNKDYLEFTLNIQIID